MKEVKWTPEIDNFIRQRFNELTLERLRDEIFLRFRKEVPELLILHRAEELGLIGAAIKDLERKKKPSYLKSQKVWLQRAETVRIKGDVRVPAGEFVPYNLIVLGNFYIGGDVAIRGGVHVKGEAVIGPRNGIGKSMVVEKDLVIGQETMIGNCVDAGGYAFISRGVVIGIERGGGGLVSGRAIFMEPGVVVRGKIYAKEGVRLVDSIENFLPDRLRV